jgi:hypothetical protein
MKNLCVPVVLGPSIADIRAQLNAYTQAGYAGPRELLQRVDDGRPGWRGGVGHREMVADDLEQLRVLAVTTAAPLAGALRRGRVPPRYDRARGTQVAGPGLCCGPAGRGSAAVGRWSRWGSPGRAELPGRHPPGSGGPSAPGSSANLQITINSPERGAVRCRHRMTGPHPPCHIGPVLWACQPIRCAF